mmetsp:Transcript_762/g.2467  ORF Transcript_762/g.2467 Transcript_762/m.2467 type:complete len:236 (+) Transcript_762:2532-3239(+)
MCSMRGRVLPATFFFRPRGWMCAVRREERAAHLLCYRTGSFRGRISGSLHFRPRLRWWRENEEARPASDVLCEKSVVHRGCCSSVVRRLDSFTIRGHRERRLSGTSLHRLAVLRLHVLRSLLCGPKYAVLLHDELLRALFSLDHVPLCVRGAALVWSRALRSHPSRRSAVSVASVEAGDEDGRRPGDEKNGDFVVLARGRAPAQLHLLHHLHLLLVQREVRHFAKVARAVADLRL